MKTFALDSDDNITVLASEETSPQPGVERFHSAEQFAALAKSWPAGRLVKIWNKLAGVHPVKKFTDRQTGVTRIWKALERPEPAGAASRPKGDKQAAPRQPRRNVGRTNTKAAQVMALLRQPAGASLKSVIAYASHCTSPGRCEGFSLTKGLFDNLTPLLFCGGLGPGCS